MFVTSFAQQGGVFFFSLTKLRAFSCQLSNDVDSFLTCSLPHQNSKTSFPPIRRCSHIMSAGRACGGGLYISFENCRNLDLETFLIKYGSQDAPLSVIASLPICSLLASTILPWTRSCTECKWPHHHITIWKWTNLCNSHNLSTIHCHIRKFCIEKLGALSSIAWNSIIIKSIWSSTHLK